MVIAHEELKLQCEIRNVREDYDNCLSFQDRFTSILEFHSLISMYVCN